MARRIPEDRGPTTKTITDQLIKFKALTDQFVSSDAFRDTQQITPLALKPFLHLIDDIIHGAITPLMGIELIE